MWTVTQLARDLTTGKTTSRELVEQALARIADPAGEGARAFLEVHAQVARADADHADALRKRGVRRSIVDGLPVSIKDLYDMAGHVTRAGSKVYAKKAETDAVAVARLRAAGAVFVGRTNMVEFAFGGVGLNPHYGTPKNPWDRRRAGPDGASWSGRVPGGSSSGAAVAQADGMCVMALGSDTRGSIRGPSALCGVVGFKPTMERVSREGAFPLSYTLDSVGPLANSVECCAAYDAVLSGEGDWAERDLGSLRLLIPKSSALDDLDREVGSAFDNALKTLGKRGATLVERPMPAFDRQKDYFKGGGFAGAEAYYIHKDRLDRLDDFDPRVGKRVILGKDLSGADYVELLFLRKEYQKEVSRQMEGFDAFLIPSAPCIAPPIAEAAASDEAYFKWNGRLLRNHGLVNFLDGCALSIPCHERGAAPVGLMVGGLGGTDRRLLAVGAAIEQGLSRG